MFSFHLWTGGFSSSFLGCPLKLLPERLVQNHTPNSHPYSFSDLLRDLEICTLLSTCLFTGLCPSSVFDLQYVSLVFQVEAYYRKWYNKKYVFLNQFFSSEGIFSTILNMKNFLKFLLIITGDLWVSFILLPNIPHIPWETGAKTEWMTVLFKIDDVGRSICNYSENWVLIRLYFT